ncbi:BadF/BadG/BcrA/BcrD ATPase family protein [Saccharopolyspora sp. TS4A08]|uniref:BadF/BadG/BcrA/BcrD ATPase family protein n=1 Tax=Saccharopolyspora ipomoeae TaxID=3042027 RepID=A0ABT6PRQ2_9PSEU|nr:BadF/BadG/BcrA/BcrD ATPase family protein [Saccharopolyspora sp. TS4A08]MDI2030694.1 BadF/BadG/BcrA/BcrD ATPase family protein [Saccharopolyspora sp. TS4A08]
MHGDDPTALVLGLDVGGTSSRALVSDLSGRVLGVGEAAGGNPNSHPAPEAVAQMASAARQALGAHDPAAVRGCVLGMAGVSKMADPAFGEFFRDEWSRLGLGCGTTPVSDGVVAFAAGTPEPRGTVLIAGTGAVAERVEEHRVVATLGGWGWLLGDEGSAYWLGREAVRATLRALERGAVIEGLAEEVCARLGVPPERKALITAANAREPIRLAELAPLVTAAEDDAAEDIVHRAAVLLADTAATARPDQSSPVVLAGGLLGPDDRIGQALRAELEARSWPEPLTAGSGAAGAAWLAALPLSPDPNSLHKTLLG